MSVVTATKRFVGDDRYKLRLFDAVAGEIRRVLDALRGKPYSIANAWSEEEFRSRIQAFDQLLADLCRVVALIGRWGGLGSLASGTDKATKGPRETLLQSAWY
jgi:hypothetical protein